MTDGELLDRMWTSMRGLLRVIGDGSDSGELVEGDGWAASVCPAVPERSFFNSVVYTEGAAVRSAIEELDERYQASGVRAWTVWVHPGDEETAAALETAGHHLDGEPMAMGIELDALAPPDGDDGGVEIAEGDVRAAGALNELGFGAPAGTLTPGVLRLTDPGAHVYVADGLSCAMTYEVDGEAGLFMVATAPAGQRRGLASRVVAHALREARERGCSTATLQATRAGYPVYRRLGFRDLGRVPMWERRR